MMKNKYDDEELYCKKLGHYLTFKYCRGENLALPCSKIRDCWFQRIDIDNYLNQNFSASEISHLFEPAKPKINSLIELIDQARQNK